MRARAVVVFPLLTGRFQVLLADMLEPAIVIHDTDSREEANRIGLTLAWSMGKRALPMSAAS